MSEVVAKMNALDNQRTAAKEAIIAFARQLEPLLRDHGANHSADRLMALFDALDGVDHDMKVHAETHARELLLHMIETLKR